MYDLLIKGGHVIDPKNGVDEKRDVGISASSIAAVQPDIPETQGRKVVDASDCYVTPGFDRPACSLLPLRRSNVP